MSIVVVEDLAEATIWHSELRALLPGVDVFVWPEVSDYAAVEMAITWDGLNELANFPNLKAAVITGVGIDHVFQQGTRVPAGVQLVRLIDDSLTSQMIEWVVMSVVTKNRCWDEYRALQQARRYEELVVPAPGEVTVGIVGLGNLGRATGVALNAIGYRVQGWSRSVKTVDGIECLVGEHGLTKLLADSDIVVCMLPLTPATCDFFNAERFAKMKPGGYFVNAARGAHVVEEDLISALDGGRLSGATLDVQRQEPLPENHAFWGHPLVKFTPHIATITSPAHCAAEVAANYRRLRNGESLLNTVDANKQY